LKNLKDYEIDEEGEGVVIRAAKSERGSIMRRT